MTRGQRTGNTNGSLIYEPMLEFTTLRSSKKSDTMFVERKPAFLNITGKNVHGTAYVESNLSILIGNYKCIGLLGIYPTDILSHV